MRELGLKNPQIVIFKSACHGGRRTSHPKQIPARCTGHDRSDMELVTVAALMTDGEFASEGELLSEKIPTGEGTFPQPTDPDAGISE